MFYYLHAVFKTPVDFFNNPKDRKQLLYEALKSSFVDGLADKEACQRFDLKLNTFRSLKRDFIQGINSGGDPARLFFLLSKVGKREKTPDELEAKVLNLRDSDLSVPDIRAVLSSQGILLSFWKIDKILKANNGKRLPRRTRAQKEQLILPDGFKPELSCRVELDSDESFDSLGGGIFLFYPVLKALDVPQLVREAGYPQTSQLSALHAVLSFLALKLMSSKRLSHSNDYALDRGLGLFAGLNVLPKNAWFASYSYRISRQMNRRFLGALLKAADKLIDGSADINLDFTTIPHWGNEAVLENNWSSTRRIGLKSVVALIAQDQQSRLLRYSDAEIKHANQSDAIAAFVDFYQESGAKLNCLIFDSKFTTYAHLNQLNGDQIKFITLRRRSTKMIQAIDSIPKEQWKSIRLGKRFKRNYRQLKVAEQSINLKGYEGELRQIFITSNPRSKPAFLITNDTDISIREVVLKYGQRWLVEQEIATQLDFYHLNRLNSSIVVKVDFDLTMSVLADTVYKLFAQQITGFQHVKPEKIYRDFIRNYTRVEISAANPKAIEITINKKTSLPLLYETDWFDQATEIPWLNNFNLLFKIGSST